ncbi:MAG: conserved phage C-terminal domain-containing protein [Acidobacteria bacterium]|nr:conserved phage C-terminal domain-containing protein [Acidobacteriota bacterium]
MKEQVQEIFEHWQRVMNHPRSKLDASRRRVIAARLKEGYTVEQIKAAIDGCKASEWHQGGNSSGAIYDGLTLICRNAEKLDFFIALNNRKRSRNREPWQSVGRPETFKASTPEPCSVCGRLTCLKDHRFD